MNKVSHELKLETGMHASILPDWWCDRAKSLFPPVLWIWRSFFTESLCVKRLRALNRWESCFEVHIFRDMSSVHTSHTCRQCIANIAVVYRAVGRKLNVRASLESVCVWKFDLLRLPQVSMMWLVLLLSVSGSTTRGKSNHNSYLR